MVKMRFRISKFGGDAHRPEARIKAIQPRPGRVVHGDDERTKQGSKKPTPQIIKSANNSKRTILILPEPWLEGTAAGITDIWWSN